MQVAPTASTSSAFVASHQYATASTSSTSRRSSRSPSSDSSRSSRSQSHLVPSPSPLRRLASQQHASSSFPSSSSRPVVHTTSLPAYSQAVSVAPNAGALALAAAAQASRLQKEKQAAVDSQMKALYEAEYREEVLEYMYEMEVSRPPSPKKHK